MGSRSRRLWIAIVWGGNPHTRAWSCGNIASMSRILGMLGVAALLLGCGTRTDSPPTQDTEASTTERETNSWRLEAGDEFYDGTLVSVERAGDKLHIQLLNRDTVNYEIRDLSNWEPWQVCARTPLIIR